MKYYFIIYRQTEKDTEIFQSELWTIENMLNFISNINIPYKCYGFAETEEKANFIFNECLIKKG